MVALVSLAGLAGAGCVKGPGYPDPRPFPGEPRLDGRWSSNWGLMRLTQTGKNVEGTVEHRKGVITGVVQGDLLLFEWSQPSNRAESVLAASGKGWLRISHDSQRLEGAWGYRDRYDGGGSWSADRPTDPE